MLRILESEYATQLYLQKFEIDFQIITKRCKFIPAYLSTFGHANEFMYS